MNRCSRFIMCRRLWDPSECFGVLYTPNFSPLDHPVGPWDQQQPSVLGQDIAQDGKWSRGDSWPAFLVLLGCSRSREIWWFCPLMLSVSRVRMKVRFAPGEQLVPSLEAPWKRWNHFKVAEVLTFFHSILTVYVLGWAIFSIFSWGDSFSRSNN